MHTHRCARVLDLRENLLPDVRALTVVPAGPGGCQTGRSGACAICTPPGGTARSPRSTGRFGVPVSAWTVMRALREANLLQARRLSARAVKARRGPQGACSWFRRRARYRSLVPGLLATSRRSRAGRGGSPGAGACLSKVEQPWHVSSTAIHLDAIEAVEFGLAEYERLFGHPRATTAALTPTPASCCPASPSSRTIERRSSHSASRRSSPSTPNCDTCVPGHREVLGVGMGARTRFATRFDVEIRTVVTRTNAIASMHARFRRASAHVDPSRTRLHP